MQLLTDLGVFILTGYLAFTNGLSDSLESFFMPEELQPEVVLTESFTPELARLESSFSDRFAIPDVLLNNNAFQSANALSASPDRPAVTYTPEEAMVNIYCTYITDTHIKATTGSGFFVSREGAVLTNAHVAQFLLLEDAAREGETECILRTGSPATATYEAKLLYIPPAWIQANAALIDAKNPTGTGERDYALLYATKRIDNQPLPTNFPHLQPDLTALNRSDEGLNIEVLGYPATPMEESGIEAELILTRAESTIAQLYTFSGPTADLMSMPDSAVSKGGSSGGPVLDKNGSAIGVIVTKGETAEDSLRALTLPYINTTIKEETGFGLADYASGDLAFKANTFQSALAPFLTTLLEFELEE